MTEREKRIIYSDNKKKKGNADRKFSKSRSLIIWINI
jgi:hypothetical protein